MKSYTLNKTEFYILKSLINIDKSFNKKSGNILLNLQVSGGMDSMCLLHAINKIVSSKLFVTSNKFVIIAQHFNHKKRGQESEDDAHLVISECLKKGVPIFQTNLKFLTQKLNFQNYARTFRKEHSIALAKEMAKNLGCHTYFVVTAHHARDHVETILQHIIRGCSLYGLQGIQEFDEEMVFFRPFYKTEYEQLLLYSQEQNVLYRTDSSNLTDDYSRNYIRNNILPHISILNRNYQNSFRKLSELSQEAQEKLKILHENEVESKKFILNQTTTSSELMHFIRTRYFEISETINKNSLDNIMHEAKLMLRNNQHSKVLPLKNGWNISLICFNNFVEIHVLSNKQPL